MYSGETEVDVYPMELAEYIIERHEGFYSEEEKEDFFTALYSLQDIREIMSNKFFNIPVNLQESHGLIELRNELELIVKGLGDKFELDQWS